MGSKEYFLAWMGGGTVTGGDAAEGMAGRGLDTQDQAAGTQGSRGTTQGSRGWTPKARQQGLNYGPEHSRRPSSSILHKTDAWVLKAPALLSPKPTPESAKGWADTSLRQQAAACGAMDITAQPWVCRTPSTLCSTPSASLHNHGCRGRDSAKGPVRGHGVRRSLKPRPVGG